MKRKVREGKVEGITIASTNNGYSTLSHRSVAVREVMFPGQPFGDAEWITNVPDYMKFIAMGMMESWG